MISCAQSAVGVAFREADPVRALDAFRRGLVIAQDSGNRFTESVFVGLQVQESTPKPTELGLL
jgi:hypothetical protein